jgi:hypothetical protein
MPVFSVHVLCDLLNRFRFLTIATNNPGQATIDLLHWFHDLTKNWTIPPLIYRRWVHLFLQTARALDPPDQNPSTVYLTLKPLAWWLFLAFWQQHLFQIPTPHVSFVLYRYFPWLCGFNNWIIDLACVTYMFLFYENCLIVLGCGWIFSQGFFSAQNIRKRSLSECGISSSHRVIPEFEDFDRNTEPHKHSMYLA